MKKIIGILFVCLPVISCIKEIDSSFLNAPTELVLECFISPSDTTIRAVLSKSTSFTSTEIPFENLFISDAQLFISNASVEKKLQYNSSKKYYELTLSEDFKIEKGENYFLKAITKEGKILHSSCRVPTKSYTPIDIDIEKSYRGTELVDIRLKWIKNSADYFIIKPYYYYSNTQIKDKPIAQKIQFFDRTNNLEGSHLISNYFTNDLTVGGKRNTIFFYVADKHFFDYSTSVELNKNSQTDPFSQPINAKYNINGGLGCFGAYTVTRIDYEF